jgi:uncharacterized tellurite resistance protein B-like protein
MLGTLKELFASFQPTAGQPARNAQQQLQLATAVLLVEVMRADPELGVAERQAVVAALREKFSLAPDEMDRLVELAEQTARTASDFFQFTSVINSSFGQEQKIRIVEMMWQVAYADGHLDAHENHLIGKIAELLYVPHGHYIAAKMRARTAAGQGD